MIHKNTIIASALSAAFAMTATASFADTICTEVATQEQAEALMTRLFPKSKVQSAEPLKLSISTSCLLEVDMLTDASNPKTKGTVYVLPDGDHFLNGPLMSKRSWLGEQSAGSAAPSSPLGAAPTITSNGGADSFITESPQSPAELRKSTLHKLLKKTNIQYAYSDSPDATASILFDIDCPYCISQFEEMEEIAKVHNLNFNWIPVYLNERSWAGAALLIRETEKNPVEGKKLLEQIMTKTISGDKLSEMFKTLTEEDFTKAKETNMIFAEIISKSRVGTPLTFVENKNGFVKISSGKLDLDEWPTMIVD